MCKVANKRIPRYKVKILNKNEGRDLQSHQTDLIRQQKQLVYINYMLWIVSICTFSS